MKGLRLFLAVLLAPLAFYGAVADDTGDIARAATRRNTTTTTSTSRKQPTNPDKKNTQSNTQTTVSRTPNIPKSGTAVRERAQTNTTNTSRSGNIIINSDRTDTNDTHVVIPRNTSKVQQRNTKTNDDTTVRARTGNVTRARTGNTTTATRTTTPQIRNTAQQISRAVTNNTATRVGKSRARNATQDTPNILERDFSKCRTIFYDCMDEFCANKDSVLKRCACSTRTNEFDRTKKSMSQVEDKLLEFNQRLLTVSMEKEDAQALNQATEGELAFATKDQSESKKMLDEIAKKLNNSFDDNSFNQGLNAISLSLDIDSAFDTVDSWAGSSTATKSGTELYNSALPVCREMALEVCTSEDLAIAESSYQMLIEQDCNTVKKSYQNQTDKARQQIFESSALLDISRLNIHQKRNSDDILTCKKKMLDMLTDPSVCGDNMGKCLDTTGRYIDPSTGEAFLTTELANLGNLISRPDQNQTWSTAPGNAQFISYLNSKKIFLEPAMENCQDISDYVWESFIEDALSQIKLAQEAKLEDMRQACTTLTTQCLDETADSISNFDSRALSIFGIAANTTANAMCADIKNACTALLNTSGGGEGWETGITAITNQKTYDTIISTCREVGRACIIQVCTSISGNFGLCENISTSINRKSIINRTACWDEVVQCVASAGESALTQIQQLNPLEQISPIINNTGNTGPKYAYYPSMYGISGYTPQVSPDQAIHFAITEINPSSDSTTPMGQIIKACTQTTTSNCVHDICATECAGDTDNKTVSNACYTCRLAERIWGNCEVPSDTKLETLNAHNRIKRPLNTNGQTDDEGTLLSWFAKNTGTIDKDDSCRATACASGLQLNKAGNCVDIERFTQSGEDCPINQHCPIIPDKLNNCCPIKDDKWIRDDFENYCQSGATTNTTVSDYYFGNTDATSTKICTKYTTNTQANIIVSQKDDQIICLGTIDWDSDSAQDVTDDYPNGKTIKCDGTLIRIQNSRYFAADGTKMSTYIDKSGETCYADANNDWSKGTVGCATPNYSSIRFK